MQNRWKVYVFKPRKPGGSWRVVPRRTVNGKRQERGELAARSEEAAHALARFYEARINAGTSFDANNPTMDSLFALRIDDLIADNASPGTIRNYVSARKALRLTLGPVGVRDLTKGKILAAEKAIKLRISESAAARYTSKAAATFRWAQDADYVAAELNWPRLPRHRKAKIKKTRKRPWTDREIVALLAWIEEHAAGWLPVVQLLADTGARVSMVLGLSEADVDRAQAVVTFRRQWIGGPAGGWRPLKGRAEGDELRVEIPAATAALLPAPNLHGLLFPNQRDPERPASLTTVGKWLTAAAEDLDIPDPDRLDTHSLRRGWVKTARELGIPNKAGMAVTGHMEEQIYLGYDRNGQLTDTRATVEAVHDHRERLRAHGRSSVRLDSTWDSTCEQDEALQAKGLEQEAGFVTGPSWARGG